MEKIKCSVLHLKAFAKWLFISVFIGLIGGFAGGVFHKCLDFANEFRMNNVWILCLLPLAGLVICMLYNLCKKSGRLDTNRVIKAVVDKESVPAILAPLIFVSTFLTQLFGGSAGREGAALQLGGSLGYNIGKIFRLNEDDLHIIVMAGMASVFTALFGTPVTAAVFAMEIAYVGVVQYRGILSCLISSAVAYGCAGVLGISPVKFHGVMAVGMSVDLISKTLILAAFCALISILFCVTIEKSEHYMKKLLSNTYVRAFVGGTVIVLLSVILKTTDYNGAGMDVVTRAMNGDAKLEAFALKILFTAITLSAGYKGGEIVPTLFIGATFGCSFGSLLGLDAAYGAAIGFVALFCGVTNCPLASLFLALEVFGSGNILMFALVCAISYVLSGNYGLYKSQKILFSKISGDIIKINTK